VTQQFLISLADLCLQTVQVIRRPDQGSFQRKIGIGSRLGSEYIFIFADEISFKFCTLLYSTNFCTTSNAPFSFLSLLCTLPGLPHGLRGPVDRLIDRENLL
jgi:hypothetical protein